MNIAFITKNDGELRAEGGVLIHKDRKAPLKMIDMIVVAGEVNITSKSLLRIAKEGTPVLFVSSDNKNFALSLPAIAKNSDLKVMQYRALEKKVEIARSILRLKFESHILGLSELGVEMDGSEYFAALEKIKSVDEALGVEGRFARV